MVVCGEVVRLLEPLHGLAPGLAGRGRATAGTDHYERGDATMTAAPMLPATARPWLRLPADPGAAATAAQPVTTTIVPTSAASADAITLEPDARGRGPMKMAPASPPPAAAHEYE